MPLHPKDPWRYMVRIVCALRAARVWIIDNSLEQAAFVAIWRPFRAFLQHLLLLLCMNMSCVGRLDPYNMFFSHEHLMSQFISKYVPLHTESRHMFTFQEIDNHKKLWAYLNDRIMSPMNTSEFTINSMPMVYVFGQIRLSQVRVRDDSCSGLKKLYKPQDKRCFSYYNEDTEDTKPFGLQKGTAWTYNLLPGLWHKGYFAYYSPNGYYVDFPRDAQGSKNALKELQDNDWIDSATRAVFMSMVTYNFNKDYICWFKLTFEMPPGSGVIPKKMAVCIPLKQYTTKSDFRRLAWEIMFAVFMILYTIQEILAVYPKNFKRYSSVWHLVHIAMMTSSWLCIIFWFLRENQANKILDLLITEGLAVQVHETMLMYYADLAIKTLAIAMFLSWLLMFRYAYFNLTAQVLETVRRSRFDLVSYLCVYAIIHCAFAQLGHNLFGNGLFMFRTFSDSALVILDIALGYFSQDEIMVKYRVFGPIFFILVVFVVIFIFHNMFFVILNYNYDSVRDEAMTKSRDVYFGTFFFNGYLNFCNLFKIDFVLKRYKDPFLKRTFMRCGFSAGCLELFEKLRGNDMLEQEDLTNVATLDEIQEAKIVIHTMRENLLSASKDIENLISVLDSQVYRSRAEDQ